MKKRDKAYEWWKRKPSNVRKPLVLTLGMLLIVLSPFTGILPGPGGIPVFLLGIAILASEYEWADKIKSFILNIAPQWVKKYWRMTPRWLYFFDFVAIVVLSIGLALLRWPIYLPIIEMNATPPFFYTNPEQHQEWWIPAAVAIIAGLSMFIFNRNRVASIKKSLANQKKRIKQQITKLRIRR